MRGAALLVVEEAPGVTGRTCSLASPAVVLGRGSDCDVVLDDREVSRRHAVVRREADRYVLADLGSRNGTLLNGQRLQGAAPLRDGDVIVIGPRFRIRFVDQDATVPAARAQPVLHVDSDSRDVSIDGRLLSPPLAPAQFSLVGLLAEDPGRVFTREDIARRCYPDAKGEVSELAVEGLVRRLRSRLAELDPDHDWVQAIRGHGYRLTPSPTTRIPAPD